MTIAEWITNGWFSRRNQTASMYSSAFDDTATIFYRQIFAKSTYLRLRCKFRRTIDRRVHIEDRKMIEWKRRCNWYRFQLCLRILQVQLVFFCLKFLLVVKVDFGAWLAQINSTHRSPSLWGLTTVCVIVVVADLVTVLTLVSLADFHMLMPLLLAVLQNMLKVVHMRGSIVCLPPILAICGGSVLW